VNLQDFILKFSEQFEETDRSEFKATTEFKTLNEWSSMLALSIIAMIDEEYSITIKGNDIRQAETIEDLFSIVQEQKT
jgi:acyl carrier protein